MKKKILLKSLITLAKRIQNALPSYLRNKIRERVFVLALLVLAIGSPIILLIRATRVSSWYDNSWDFRTPITITYSGSTITNTDLLVEIDTQALISEAKMQLDCDDIRLIDEDDSTELQYWIENECNTENTQVWVKIPELDDGGKTIYIYYGNETAISSEEIWSGDFITLSDNSCPTGWSRAEDYDDKFPMGSESYGAIGGADSHGHAQINVTSSSPTNTALATNGSAGTTPTSTHTHTNVRVDINNTSVLPPYRNMIVCEKDKIPIKSGLIVISDDSTPSGWTLFSNLDGYIPRGSSTYGSTGGSNTHTHTTTGGYNTSTNTSIRNVNNSCSEGYDPGSHHHVTNNGSTESANNIPPYLKVLYIKASSDTIVPIEGITMSTEIPPLGWQDFSAMHNRFPLGALTYGETGGSSTHSHTVNITMGSPIGSISINRCNSGSAAARGHTHTASGTSDSQSNIPPHIETLFVQKIDPIAETIVGSEESRNQSPNAPSLISPASGTTSASLTLSFEVNTTDLDGDDIQYKIVLCKSSNMLFGCQEFDQTQSQTGWSGQNAESSTMYQSGSEATYTIQSPIEAGTTYYWKSYAIDPDGLNEWSETQSAARVFNTNSHPRSPSVDNYEHFTARRENAFNATSSGWNSIEGAAAAGTTASINGWIGAANLTAGDRYLIMVWGEHNSDNLNATSGLRVKHGSTAFSESQSIEKTGNTSTSHKTPYHWFTVWEAVNEESLEVELYWGGEAGSQARVEDVTLVAINAEELIANGDLVYDINTGTETLTDDFEEYAEITWTPANDLDPWMVLGYVQPDIQNLSDTIESRISLNSTPYTSQSIDKSKQFLSDTPIYGIGTISALDNDSSTDISVETRETGTGIGDPATQTLAPSENSSSGSVSNPTNAYYSDNSYAVIAAWEGGNNLDVSLSWNGGGNFTTNKTETLPNGSGNEGVIDYGDNADTWGRSWSPSEISSSDFVVKIEEYALSGGEILYSGFSFSIPSGSTIDGIEVNIEGYGTQPSCPPPPIPCIPDDSMNYIDNVEVTIYYTEPGGYSVIQSSALAVLNLNAFRDSIFDSYIGNGNDMNTPFDWVEQLNADPTVKIQNNWLVAGGGLVFDPGSQVITRIQSNDANITDDIGGWSKTNTHPLSTNIADMRSAWTTGLKNLDLDSQTTLSGNAQFIDGWLAAFSLEKATDTPGPRPDLPTNEATNQSLTPQLRMTAIDAENENLKYKVEICTNLAMTEACQVFDQTQSQTGWTGKNANSNTRYTSGTQAIYTPQTPLLTNTTYYWRPYAIDETGTNSFSQKGETFSFTTTSQPTQPTDLQTEGQPFPQAVTDQTPEFTAIHNDPDEDQANSWKIQVNTSSDFTGTMMWNPNRTSMAATNSSERSPEISYSGNTLNIVTTYYWRIKFWDINGAEGPWSEVASFKTTGLVKVNGCNITKANNNTSITINWSDNNTIETGYKIQKSTNGGSFSDLAAKTANSTYHTDSSISDGNAYQYRIAATLLPEVGPYCTTGTASLDRGNLYLEGLKFEGIQIF